MEVKELEKLIKDIGVIIDFYSSLGSDFKDIDRLITGKRKLTGYAFRFAEIVGDALENYNNSNAFRKRHIAEKALKYIEDGNPVGKSEMKAELLNYKYKVDEGHNEALYRKVKLKYDSIRDTISSIQQDISVLRKEFEDSKNND